MSARNLVLSCSVCAAVLCALAVPAIADWDPGDGHKMHYPQLPDPNGWDVGWTNLGGEPVLLADDWTCSATGPVTDVHFWFSSKNDDFQGDPSWFEWGGVGLSIWTNNPDGGQGYSVPEERIASWHSSVGSGTVTFREYGTGDQGWIWPDEDFVQNDHQTIWQMNITDIVFEEDQGGDEFVQQEGQVYWLGILASTFDQMGTPGPEVGWKTSLDHHLDDAVWALDGPAPFEWSELRDPITAESLDLAFVITPEPATMGLVGLGVIGLVARRRRK